MSQNTFFSSITISAPEPIDQRLIVEIDEDASNPKTKTDLISIENKYPNMVVFVRSTKLFYYLKDSATGTSISDWSTFGSDSKFTVWDSTKTYSRGACVYLGSSGNLFYVAISASTNVNPIGSLLWLQLGSGSGSVLSATFSIPDNTVALGHSSRNFAISYSAIGDYPVVECWLNVYNAGITEKHVCQPELELDRNAVGAVMSSTLRFVFNGKINDIFSTSSGNSITGKITIR